MRYWPLLITMICILLRTAESRADGFELDLAPIAVDSAQIEIPDSLGNTAGPTYAEQDWKYLLKHKQLNFEDPNVRWPSPFIGWCIGVYNWANRTFNSYDPAWVRGGKYKFKALLLSDNWLDAYAFDYRNFPYLVLWDRMYPNVGVYFKYLGLSIGYSVDVASIFTGEKSTHRKLSLGLTCARFMIDAQLWESNVSTYVRGYGKENLGVSIKVPFNGLTFREANISGFYFFNNSRFSIGSVYSYNNNQVRSSGSAIAGFSFNMYGADFDFTKLTDKLPNFHKYPFDSYTFHYRSYNFMGGYSHNFVLHRKWGFNLTAIPGIGITESSEESTTGKKTLASFYGKVMAGVLYTNKRFFTGMKVSVTGNLFRSGDVLFINALQNYQLAVGIKF